uniref:Uncharacterized protein n=1 Tax=Oryza glumipatula TaxID=40148 RepID=A0A0D9Z4R9_9ORYZ
MCTIRTTKGLTSNYYPVMSSCQLQSICITPASRSGTATDRRGEGPQYGRAQGGVRGGRRPSGGARGGRRPSHGARGGRAGRASARGEGAGRDAARGETSSAPGKSRGVRGGRRPHRCEGRRAASSRGEASARGEDTAERLLEGRAGRRGGAREVARRRPDRRGGRNPNPMRLALPAD